MGEMSRSVQLLIIGALAVVVVCLAVVFAGGSGDDNGISAEEKQKVENMFRGIPQDGVLLGDKQAPATIVEFADLQCPFCADFSKDALPGIIRDYVRTGKVNMELRLIAVVGSRVQSTTAATAAAAAEKQNKLWQFSELFYLNQGVEETGYITDDFINSIYEGVGVDVSQATTDRSNADLQQAVARNDSLASRVGVDSTPSLFLLQGKEYSPIPLDSLDYKSVRAAIDKAL